MRTLRLTLYFVIGLLLGAWVTVATAQETCDGTICTRPADNAGTSTQFHCKTGAGGVGSYGAWFETQDAACTASGGRLWDPPGGLSDACWETAHGNYPSYYYACQTGVQPLYTCPPGQNWTLSGTVCTRPQPCQKGQQTTTTYYRGDFSISTKSGVYAGPVRPAPTALCNGQCSGNVTETQIDCASIAAASVANPQPIQCTAKINLTGTSCTTTDPVPTPTPTIPSNNPPCTSDQGVLQGSDGKVLCVQKHDVPNSETPKVKKNEVKETFSDGSEKTVTTTETCTGDGACSTTTTTNVTNNSSGQPGLAGTPGTTTGTGNSNSEGQIDDTKDLCAANPNLQICKGGISEEGTQKKVLQELERFNNPGATDDSELITHAATAIANSDAVKNQDNDLGQYVTGEKKNEGIEGQKGAWASAMSSGWIDPIELGGCAPIVSNFADKVWILDVCPTAAKISEIGAYAMWFLLAVGAFVMVTGGKQG